MIFQINVLLYRGAFVGSSYSANIPGFGGFSLAEHNLALTEGYQLK
jgi:hypothetical protein